jgi:hypothetical protein
VFKNVDHAFPFFFRQAKMSAAAALDGLKQVKGKLDAKYGSEIKHLLVSIDEKNGSVQAHLRAAYVLYSAAPCKKLDYLQAAIEAIRDDERDLRAAEMAIRQLVTLLSVRRNGTGVSDPAVSARISELIGQVVMALNHRTPFAALVEKMGQVARFTEEWRHP